MKLITGNSNLPLARAVASYLELPLADALVRRFADEEIFVEIGENVRGEDVFVIQSTGYPANDNLMELLIIIDALRRASARRITAVLPYMGYARQDRKPGPRTPISAKLVANLITTAGAHRVLSVDLHAGQIQGFFDFPVDHLDGTAIFVPYLRSLHLENLVFASPDVGGVSRARSFAKHFHADIVVCDKHRKRANEVASMQVIGDVEGANVVLIDDLIDTGGTICKAAQILREKGAVSVRAVCTHPIMSGNAYELVETSELAELVVSDTLPLKQASSKIKVLTVADLFAKAIRNVHDHESISSLFINLHQ